ncbi:hypothetical protein WKI71_24320 [Streptomyces sp. MS1.AVA.1]|uniref:DUF4232 domain-containing protein n=1 Tax=Streptomyces machairae TaxID=3134109 RepID=A0ABU8UND7_9ACTN
MNHGPDDQSPEGFDSDELALRRMLHTAVDEIEPRDGTLDHLRRAVPHGGRASGRRSSARRPRCSSSAPPSRLCCTSPTPPAPTSTRPSPATASRRRAEPGRASRRRAARAPPAAPRAAPTRTRARAARRKTTRAPAPVPARAPEGPTTPWRPARPGIAVCTPDQLGASGASADLPDSSGTVYGTFRFSNVSGTECTVSGPGTVGVVPQGAADPTKVTSARHIAGDAAVGLPDPSTEYASLVLKAGASYEVKFAWLPSATCPTTGDNNGGGSGGPDPSPDPTPTEDPPVRPRARPRAATPAPPRSC